MRIELESSLQRWMENQIIDAGQAERIRAFETGHRKARWPVVMALAFGGIMLAAGVLLFVSAHWDRLSPFNRMTVLVLALASFHLAGAFSRERFHALSVTMHAVGSVALGGAVFLAGQIFNLQEHWPSGVLLWAVGAVAAWLLLGDRPQMALVAILVPWWLVGEWTEWASSRASFPIAASGILLLAICYFSVRDRWLVWIGGIALLPAVLIAAFAARERGVVAVGSPEAIGWAGVILISLAVAYAYRRAAAWMNMVAAVWVIGLTLIAEQRLDVLLYAWCALGSAAMIAWGIHELRAERINLGMAGFALTIVFFFFSSVMDKLGRSASLISLGILFVAGSWYWEKLRRRLVAQVQPGGAQ
jgi:uncharacterized membrane protein